MVWTEEDATDIRAAVAKAKVLVTALNGDLSQKKARPSTRAAVTAALDALLALDDVYFERANGSPGPDVWRRARLTVRREK